MSEVTFKYENYDIKKNEERVMYNKKRCDIN